MKTRRISTIMALLTVVGLLLAACATPEPTATPTDGGAADGDPGAAPEMAEGTPYKIGFCASITGPGSSLGIPERNTAEMLAEQYADGIIGADGVHHALEVDHVRHREQPRHRVQRGQPADHRGCRSTCWSVAP